MDNKEIWSFVETKLNCKVPEYIKNVLEVCGYDNGITISTIELTDIQYFEDEVKKGNVSKHFGDEKDALAGSNKTKENFEFVRGHVKLLLQIKDFLKSHLDTNGPDFTLHAKIDDKAKAVENVSDQAKEKRGVKRKIAIDGNQMSDEEKHKHQEVIYAKMVKALNELTPDMLREVKQKRSLDLVQVELITKNPPKSVEEPSDEENVTSTLVGDIICIYCSQPIRVFYDPSVRNAFLWKTTNWNRHLTIVHKGSKNSKNIRKGNDKANDGTESVTESQIQSTSASNEFDSAASGTETTEPSTTAGNKKPTQNVSVINLVENVEMSDIQQTNQSVEFEDNSGEKSNTSEPPGEPSKMASAIAKIVSYSDSSEDEADYATERSGKNENSSSDLPDAHTEKNFVKVSQTETIHLGVDKLDAYGTQHTVSIPIIRNGHSSTQGKQTIITSNTCSFDSILSIYLCLCFDDDQFRESITTLSKKSSFAMLIRSYHNMFNSQQGSKAKAASSELNNFYAERNIILKELFLKSSFHLNNNVKKKDDLLFIDCNTGIGRLFGQMCVGICPYVASAIEIKTCENCKKKAKTVLPFIPVAVNGTDLSDIQKSIRPLKSKGRCNVCQGKCVLELSYNNVLVLEVEPNSTVKYQKKISIGSLTQTVTVGKKFHLRAIIEYVPKIHHFKSHIKRINGKWMTYDDIQNVESEIEELDEVLPYMLFYAKDEFDEDFLNAWSSNISKKTTPTNESATRTASKVEKKPEKKWKY